MADPYSAKSLLGKSQFQGFYSLFFMYSVIFMIAYPILSLFEARNIFGLSLDMILRTNIFVDFITVFVFVMLSTLFSELAIRMPALPIGVVFSLITITYMGGSVLIVHHFQMFFTDRIFIIVLSWSLGIKTISLIRDTTQPSRDRDWHDK